MNYSSYNTYTPTSSDEQAARPEQVREITGGTRLTVQDGKVETQQLGRAAIQTDGRTVTEDWRSTARTSGGMPAARITPETMVTLDEYGESTVKTFVTMGLLREIAPGHFERVSQEAARQDEPSEDQGDIARVPEELVQAENEALAPFSDSVVEAGLAMAIASAAGEITWEQLVAKMSNDSGVEPSETAQRLEFVWNSRVEQTSQYLIRNGIAATDLEDFVAYAETQKGHFKDAIQAQMYGNSMAGWKPLVRGFLNAVAPSAQALERAGFRVNGDQVRVEGGWMPIKAAARAGLI